jgi:hypothetical protein
MYCRRPEAVQDASWTGGPPPLRRDASPAVRRSRRAARCLPLDVAGATYWALEQRLHIMQTLLTYGAGPAYAWPWHRRSFGRSAGYSLNPRCSLGVFRCVERRVGARRCVPAVEFSRSS